MNYGTGRAYKPLPKHEAERRMNRPRFCLVSCTLPDRHDGPCEPDGNDRSSSPDTA